MPTYRSISEWASNRLKRYTPKCLLTRMQGVGRLSTYNKQYDGNAGQASAWPKLQMDDWRRHTNVDCSIIR
jgi:hypothetical protein